MASSQVAEGGNGPQIWRVAANILNKQLQTSNKRCLSAWGLGVGLPTPHLKKCILLRNVTRILWDLAEDRDQWRALGNMVMNL
jgi:hypothetical protein